MPTLRSTPLLTSTLCATLFTLTAACSDSGYLPDEQTQDGGGESEASSCTDEPCLAFKWAMCSPQDDAANFALPTDLDIDEDGRLSVTGTARGDASFGGRAIDTGQDGRAQFVFTYDPSGNLEWAQVATGSLEGSQVARLTSGAVVTGGFVYGPFDTEGQPTKNDREGSAGYLWMIDADGATDTVSTFTTLEEEGISFDSLDASEDGTLGVAASIGSGGLSIAGKELYDWMVAEFDASGEPIWVAGRDSHRGGCETGRRDVKDVFFTGEDELGSFGTYERGADCGSFGQYDKTPYVDWYKPDGERRASRDFTDTWARTKSKGIAATSIPGNADIPAPEGVALLAWDSNSEELNLLTVSNEGELMWRSRTGPFETENMHLGSDEESLWFLHPEGLNKYAAHGPASRAHIDIPGPGGLSVSSAGVAVMARAEEAFELLGEQMNIEGGNATCLIVLEQI